MNGMTPQEYFTVIGDDVKRWAELGRAKNSRKLIHWRKTDMFECPITHEDRYGLDIWQEGGAKIHLTVRKRVVDTVDVVGNDPRTTVVDSFAHDGQPQKSFDLLATVLEYRGKYTPA